MADAVAEAAGGHPADDLVAVPYWLVADRIGIRGSDVERDQPPLATAGFLGQGRVAADEPVPLEVDEPPEAGLEGAVNRPELTRPVTEALLQAH